MGHLQYNCNTGIFWPSDISLSVITAKQYPTSAKKKIQSAWNGFVRVDALCQHREGHSTPSVNTMGHVPYRPPIAV